jgi:hypothetical protein
MFRSHLDDDLKVKSPIIKVFDMLLQSFEKSCFENLWKKTIYMSSLMGSYKKIYREEVDVFL